MLKNIIKKLIILYFILVGLLSTLQANAFKWSDYINIRYWNGWGGWTWDWPEIWCRWLPWCKGTSSTTPESFLVNFIEKFIQVVAVLAVFALIFSWIKYIISSWDEEEAKHAKNWIIWSLVWVFLSTSAWWIIILLNNLTY